FRWTKEARISWPCRVPVAPCSVAVRIPFFMAIDEGFPDQCTLEFDGKQVELDLQPFAQWQALCATIELAVPGDVSLVTPPPRVTPTDARALGIALAVKG